MPLSNQIFYFFSIHFGPQFLHHDPPNSCIVTGIWILRIYGRGLLWIYEGGYGRTDVRRIVE